MFLKGGGHNGHGMSRSAHVDAKSGCERAECNCNRLG